MLERYTRLQVFSVHLSISAVIFVLLAVAMVAHWFPGPFFATDGGWQGMRIIAAVDLVLGPALTLIFFNPKLKKHGALLFDLSTIAVVQVIALVWGTWTVYNERTVAIAFSRDQFYSISHGALAEANASLSAAEKRPVDIYALSDTHPRQIYVTPMAPHELGQYLADVLNGLPEIQLRTDRYTELARHWDDVDKEALDIREFAREHAELTADVTAAEGELDALQFYRLKLRFGAAVVGFTRDSRELKYIFTYQPPPPPEPEEQQDGKEPGQNNQ